MVLEDKVRTAAAPAALPVSPQRRRHRGRWAALALLAAMAVWTLWFSQAYRGMWSGIINQMRYGTFQENWNLGKCNFYWLKFMQQLRLDPATGAYNFKNTSERGMDLYERGLLAFHRGDFPRAISLLESHIKEKGESESSLFWLAMSYMRQAEADNCLAQLLDRDSAGGAHAGHAGHEMGAFCSLPLSRLHSKEESSRQAARLFQRILDHHSPSASDARLYRWLLNFSYMTVGGFPSQVPARYAIHTPFTEAFYGAGAERARRENPDLVFVDRAAELGAENYGTGRGVAVEDFDNDGYLDMAVTGELNTVRFYHNDAGRGFTDVTRQVGLDGVVQAFTMSAVDFNNDGWMDLFVVRPFGHFLLFQNRGDGTFTDVTPTSGLIDGMVPEEIAASWISAWGDVDNDGDLDLFIANWGFRMPLVGGIMAKPRMDSKLFLNEGGHFRDATAEFGLRPVVDDRYFIGAAFGDYDNDGRVDLYLTSPLRGTSVLLHNAGGKRFERDPRMTRTEPGFTGTFVDVNHDGRLDLFQAGFGDARTSIQQSVYGEHADDYKTGHSTILLQTPDGRFEEHNEFFEGAMPMGTMGANFGDLDNDGCLDFYLGTGNPEPWFILPNLMYHGEEDPAGHCTGRMRNVSMLNGFGNIQKGHGIVFFDFNNDGKQDVYSSLGGMWPNDKWVSQLFVNESPGDRSWVKIRLRGRRSNSSGVGSRIAVHAVTAAGAPVVRTYNMDNKTGFGSAPYLAHIGLDRATRIDHVSVRWLGSGCTADYPARIRELNVLDEADCLKGRR